MNDLPQILTGLEQIPTLLATLVRGIPAARLKERRGLGFWTIEEHLHHLVRLQPVLLERFQRVLAEDNPEFPLPVHRPPVVDPALDVEQALARFAEQRGLQMDLLRRVAPADWSRPGSRADYDDFGLYTLARHTFLHDTWHMYRMEELWLVKDGFVSA